MSEEKEQKKKRETGYYWVRIEESHNWSPMIWDGNFFKFENDSQKTWAKDQMFEVNEHRILNPDEMQKLMGTLMSDINRLSKPKTKK